MQEAHEGNNIEGVSTSVVELEIVDSNNNNGEQQHVEVVARNEEQSTQHQQQQFNVMIEEESPQASNKPITYYESSPTAIDNNSSITTTTTNKKKVKLPPPMITKSIQTKQWQVDFSKFPIIETDKATKLKKRVSKFYEKQNELVEGFADLYTNTITKDFLVDGEDGYLELNDELKEENPIDSSAKDDRYANFCIQASFWVNILLLFLKVSASFLSISLSVITSTVDSILDIVSGLILVYTNHLRKKKGDSHKYPVGKDRLEPLSFIIFATCMATASLQIIKEGVVTIIQGLVTGDPYLPANNENLISWSSQPETLSGEMEWMLGIKVPATFKLFAYSYSLAVMLVAVVLKTILYFLCIRAKSASCEAYAFDHRNDVLSNSFLVASLFISMWAWWVDPFSATVLSCYIIYGWVGESMEHVTKLVGLSAESDLIQKLTFIAYNHCEKIVKVDLVTAWYSGMNIIAEIHVVLPPDMSLKEAHNIGAKLQTKIESVPEVERCFVHLDFNDTHKNERSLIGKDV